MYMVCFSCKEDGTKMWFPHYDVLFIQENRHGTVIRVKDRSCNDSFDFCIQEEAQQILDQIKNISKGE